MNCFATYRILFIKLCIKTPIILDCGCNSHGTNTENGTAICDSSFGNCSCTTGYSGQKCDHCVNGYFITNPGGSNSTCNGCCFYLL